MYQRRSLAPSETRFGGRLAELRHAAGLSQRAVADLAGIHHTYLSHMERGQQPPPGVAVIARIADALGADSDELTVLAGKVPPDLARALSRDPDAIKAVRKVLAMVQDARDRAATTAQQRSDDGR